MKHYDNWIDLINQRDTFYLYLFLAVLTAFLWYRWLKLWRYFKIMVMCLTGVICGGIAWGAWQLW